MRKNMAMGKKILVLVAVFALLGMLAGAPASFAADKVVKVGNI